MAIAGSLQCLEGKYPASLWVLGGPWGQGELERDCELRLLVYACRRSRSVFLNEASVVLPSPTAEDANPTCDKAHSFVGKLHI